MGFANREGGKFFTIMGGKLVMRVPADTAGAVARVNKEGRTVHEIKHDSFTGKLVNIRVRTGAYGKEWGFDFRDGGDLYTLQLMYNNSLAVAILKMLPNVDLSKEMKVQPSAKLEGDKTKQSIFISQDGKTLKHAYTKDNPNGMPDMEQVVVNGVAQWDSTKRLAFLEEMVKRDILPKLPRDTAPAATAASAADDAADADDVFGTDAPADDENDF